MSTPIAKSIDKRTVKAKAAKMVKTKKVNKTNIINEVKKLSQATDVDRVDFLNALKESESLSDEDILERLSPFLKRSPNGRPPSVTYDISRDKVLLAYRLKQRGLTNIQISEQMEVSAQMVGKYMTKAEDYMRVNPHSISLPQKVGDTLYFYDDIRQMSLLIASTNGNSVRDRLYAMQIALGVERDKNVFLTSIGVYSPPVTAVFQQLIAQQISSTYPMPTNDKQENTVDNFFSQLSEAFKEIGIQDELMVIDTTFEESKVQF